MATMDKAVINQPITITLDTKSDLTGASSTLIKYNKPNGGGTGTFSASITGTGNTKLQATVAADVLDTAGVWELISYPTLAGDAGPTPGFEVYKLAVISEFDQAGI